jgi:hypothetical protein
MSNYLAAAGTKTITNSSNSSSGFGAAAGGFWTAAMALGASAALMRPVLAVLLVGALLVAVGVRLLVLCVQVCLQLPLVAYRLLLLLATNVRSRTNSSSRHSSNTRRRGPPPLVLLLPDTAAAAAAPFGDYWRGGRGNGGSGARGPPGGLLQHPMAAGGLHRLLLLLGPVQPLQQLQEVFLCCRQLQVCTNPGAAFPHQ